MKKLINVWKVSVGWDSMTTEQRKFAVIIGIWLAISIWLASIHYVLGFFAFCASATYMHDNNNKLNVKE